MELLLAALSGSGITVALLAIAAHLGRSQLAHWLNKDLERERARLATDVERVKADLTKLNAEHTVRFTSLHAKRAEVVAKLYSLLVKASWAAESFLSPL